MKLLRATNGTGITPRGYMIITEPDDESGSVWDVFPKEGDDHLTEEKFENTLRKVSRRLKPSAPGPKASGTSA